MARHKAEIIWNRNGAVFTDNRYSREHRWIFDGGIEVPASSSPQVVPLPLSLTAAIDPEEAFVASLSSCHMLWFLSIAARRGFVVESYRDEAEGTVAKDSAGKQAVTVVVLRPHVAYYGKVPTEAESQAIHEEAHDRCFIANSVRTEVKCEPVNFAAAT